MPQSGGVVCHYPTGSNILPNQIDATWLTAHISSAAIAGHTQPDTSDATNREPSSSVKPHGVLQRDLRLDIEEDSSWQVVGDDLLVVLTEEDVTRLVDIFPGVLSSMRRRVRTIFGGHCFRCKCSLSRATSFVDHYDANMYCADCHQLQESIIPRDVLFNWDFTPRSVSQPTKLFLRAIYHLPIVDLSKINPSLYAVVPRLIIIRQLRRAVVLLWHQLARCDAKTATDFRNSLQPADYMASDLNELDVYSLRDLCQVQSGELEIRLVQAITGVALSHVHACLACRRRALLCDICGSLQKPVWPHEFSTYKRCATQGCASVMHTECLRSRSAEPVPENSSTCLACYSLPFINARLNASPAQCNTCSIYGKLFSHQSAGHYADPFPSQLQERVEAASIPSTNRFL